MDHIENYLTGEEYIRFIQLEEMLNEEIDLDILKRAQAEWMVLIEKANVRKQKDEIH